MALIFISQGKLQQSFHAGRIEVNGFAESLHRRFIAALTLVNFAQQEVGGGAGRVGV